MVLVSWSTYSRKWPGLINKKKRSQQARLAGAAAVDRGGAAREWRLVVYHPPPPRFCRWSLFFFFQGVLKVETMCEECAKGCPKMAPLFSKTWSGWRVGVRIRPLRSSHYRGGRPVGPIGLTPLRSRPYPEYSRANSYPRSPLFPGRARPGPGPQTLLLGAPFWVCYFRDFDGICQKLYAMYAKYPPTEELALPGRASSWTHRSHSSFTPLPRIQ